VTYRVLWRLHGRNGRALDDGCLDAAYGSYGAAISAVSELLQPYPDVTRHDGCWLARRSRDADLVVRVWVEAPGADSDSGEEEPAEAVRLQA
jgi:hypothetical protein